MLRICIDINGGVIYTFYAVNISKQYGTGKQTYRVQKDIGKNAESWKIRHNFKDGAVVLSNKIIASALRRYPELKSNAAITQPHKSAVETSDDA